MLSIAVWIVCSLQLACDEPPHPFLDPHEEDHAAEDDGAGRRKHGHAHNDAPQRCARVLAKERGEPGLGVSDGDEGEGRGDDLGGARDDRSVRVGRRVDRRRRHHVRRARRDGAVVGPGVDVAHGREVALETL